MQPKLAFRELRNFKAALAGGEAIADEVGQ
jgi:hypothetical protein